MSASIVKLAQGHIIAGKTIEPIIIRTGDMPHSPSLLLYSGERSVKFSQMRAEMETQRGEKWRAVSPGLINSLALTTAKFLEDAADDKDDAEIIDLLDKAQKTAPLTTRHRAHYSDLIHSPHFFRVADSDASRMDKLTDIVLGGSGAKGEEELEETSSGALDWLFAAAIFVICIVFLIVAVKICYNYSKKFPESSEKDSDTVDQFNRRAISTKGTRGYVRYSVA
uniref:Uncharacterized protein n=1 Tax=Caenorhabditis japonica TaxID=281687 RepID=A0A8R1ERS0_CAEJA